MYAILGEDSSHTLCIEHIIRRIANDNSIRIKPYSFGSCGSLLAKGHRVMKLLHEQGWEKFIIVYDSDGEDPEERRESARKQIVAASGVDSCVPFVVLIPVQELEAWILADNHAMSCVIRSWTGKDVPNPESIKSPKEHLIVLTRNQQKKKPRYDPVAHNPRIAQNLDLDKVYAKCPSFRPLREFVLMMLSGGNLPS